MKAFTLESYLLLVNYTGRLFREGRVLIEADLAHISIISAAPPRSRNRKS